MRGPGGRGALGFRAAGLSGESVQGWLYRFGGGHWSAEVVARLAGLAVLLVALGGSTGEFSHAGRTLAAMVGRSERTVRRWLWVAAHFGMVWREFRGSVRNRLSTRVEVRVAVAGRGWGPPTGLVCDAVRFCGLGGAAAVVLLWEKPGMGGAEVGRALGVTRQTGRAMVRRLAVVVAEWRAMIDGAGPGAMIEQARKRKAERQPKAKAQPKARPAVAEAVAQPKAEAEPEAERGPPGAVADAIKSAREKLASVRHLR